ncbi:MAG: hypothetical protein KKH88_02040 [Nanoarchaeota archaeon]|nr:hypothetical protein [Nanoarchaeota archaeon]
MENKVFDLIKFIPQKIVVGSKNNLADLRVKQNKATICLSYKTQHYNNAFKKHSLIIPRFIKKSNETFEVLGLLQGEMNKTQNGCITFANSEPKIINKVLKWFEKECDISKNNWKWYLAINMQEPSDKLYKYKIENKIIRYWLDKTKIKVENSYPKKISYRRVVHNKLKKAYYGCLMVEFKNNLFSQIFKKFLKTIVYDNLIEEDKENIKAFMRGIIAAEGSIAYHSRSWHYAVHISAIERKEREIYKKCLSKLSINAKIYNNYKEILISEKQNLIQLLNQRLITIHPKKYNKFLNMMKQYPNIKEETEYFKPKGKNVWNKISQEKIDEIIKYKKTNPAYSCRKIAKLTGVSFIKVNRVLKEYNLGKRVNKTPEKIRREIVKFSVKNPEIKQYELAEHFKVSKSVVSRAIRKYSEELKNN